MTSAASRGPIAALSAWISFRLPAWGDPAAILTLHLRLSSPTWSSNNVHRSCQDSPGNWLRCPRIRLIRDRCRSTRGQCGLQPANRPMMLSMVAVPSGPGGTGSGAGGFCSRGGGGVRSFQLRRPVWTPRDVFTGSPRARSTHQGYSADRQANCRRQQGTCW